MCCSDRSGFLVEVTVGPSALLTVTGQTSRLQYVVGMDPDDPKRMDKIREYAAIYGRFDCKRKAEKPLTLHEVKWLSKSW